MSQQTINNGASDNDPTAESVRNAFTKVNDMMTEIYGSGINVVLTNHTITAASANPKSIKASAGTLRGVTGFNAAAYPVYIKFHNTAGTPSAGTGVVYTIGVQAGLPFNIPVPGGGRAFASGIGMTVVKGIADTDATAVAANDALIEVYYE